MALTGDPKAFSVIGLAATCSNLSLCLSAALGRLAFGLLVHEASPMQTADSAPTHIVLRLPQGW